MTSRRAISLAVGCACLCLAVMGFLAGIVVERVRFDARRSAVLSSLASDERRVRAYLMDLERDAGRAARSGAQDAARGKEATGKPGP